MRSVSGFMWYDECLCGRRVREARGFSSTSCRWLYTLRGKSQSAAYYGGGWRRSRNCSGYLSASRRRAVSKRTVRHISVSGPRAPPAPRLKKDDELCFCGNTALILPPKILLSAWLRTIIVLFCGRISSLSQRLARRDNRSHITGRHLASSSSFRYSGRKHMPTLFWALGRCSEVGTFERIFKNGGEPQRMGWMIMLN